MDLFKFPHPGGFQQIFIDGAGAFIVQMDLGHRGTVDFTF
jgi:hypothetical protein